MMLTNPIAKSGEVGSERTHMACGPGAEREDEVAAPHGGVPCGCF
jgi:hypothetical protein